MKRAGMGRALVGCCQVLLSSSIESTGSYTCLILAAVRPGHQGAGHLPRGSAHMENMSAKQKIRSVADPAVRTRCSGGAVLPSGGEAVCVLGSLVEGDHEAAT